MRRRKKYKRRTLSSKTQVRQRRRTQCAVAGQVHKSVHACVEGAP